MGSERITPIVIPPPAPDPEKLDPQPRCLDYPPQFFARLPSTPGSPRQRSAPGVPRWAERKPDVVMQAYAPSFQAPGQGGSAAFLRARGAGRDRSRPVAVLQDLTVTKDGDDRRVVTLRPGVRRQKVHRELTLVRDGQTWRIVSERTLATP